MTGGVVCVEDRREMQGSSTLEGYYVSPLPDYVNLLYRG
jgi:hypothetical protein